MHILEILEKIVTQQLYSFLNSNNKQDVFQAGLNTESALADVVSDPLLASDSGFVSVLVLLDLNAACYINYCDIFYSTD